MHRLLAAVDVAVLHHSPEHAQLRRLVLGVQGQVGALPLPPAPEPAARPGVRGGGKPACTPPQG